MILQIMLVIYRSPNGRDSWMPLRAHEVPEWVREPEVMGRLVAGKMCMDPKSESGTDWFRAERVENIH